MRAKIMRVDQRTSKFGGTFFYAFLKDSDGNSYRTCLYPQYRNFSRWQKPLELSKTKEVWLDNLFLKGTGVVDADSDIRIANGLD